MGPIALKSDQIIKKIKENLMDINSLKTILHIIKVHSQDQNCDLLVIKITLLFGNSQKLQSICTIIPLLHYKHQNIFRLLDLVILEKMKLANNHRMQYFDTAGCDFKQVGFFCNKKNLETWKRFCCII